MLQNLKIAASRRVLAFAWQRWCTEPFRLVTLVVLVSLSTAADICIPVATGWLVDTVSAPDAEQSRTWTMLGLMMALAAISIATKVMSHFTYNSVAVAVMRALLMDGFSRVQRLPTDWHAGNFAGATVRKITRGGWALDDLGETLFTSLFPAALALVGTAITLSMFRAELGFVAIMGSAVFIALSLQLSIKWVAPAAALSNAQDSRLSGAMADALSSNAVVKAFAAELREDARLARIVTKWAHRTHRTWRRATVSGMSQAAILWSLQAIVLGSAVLAWARGLAGPGDIAFAVTAFATLQGYLRSIGQQVQALQQAVNEMEELVDLMECAPEAQIARRPARGLPEPRRGALTFANVGYGYVGAKTPLFKGLSVTIPAGQKVGLVGRSGSGKTTFVKLLQRLHQITNGAITFDGVDIASLPLEDLRRALAVVPQDPILFHRSLADNIAYARPGADMAAITQAAVKAGAEEFIDAAPKGYATMVGERGVKLSGGERQRIAIARAFLSDAPVLVMDEATSSLDSLAEAKVAAAAQRLMEGRTTLVIAHRLATVAGLDRLLVFDKGRIVEDGTPTELFEDKSSVYRTLHDRQFKDLVT